MTTVVLGWDALDATLLEEFGLDTAFGSHSHRIGTFDNPVTGEPLTREVWPSIITGVPPDEHGIHGATPEDGLEWENPLIDAASSLTKDVLPHWLRAEIGVRLRDRGQEVKQYDPSHYAERGVPTVFDGEDSRAISVPNYRTSRDEKVGVGTDRTAIWTDVIETVERGSSTAYRPLVPLEEVEEHLLAKAHKRMGLVRAGLNQDRDLVFCWFGFLDTVGHLDVMVDRADWQRDAYELAARMTSTLRDELAADDTLVCVSDHGLRNGQHTHDATIAGPADVVRSVESVFDVRDALEETTESSGNTSTDGWSDEGHHDVEETLEALGYV